MSLVQLDSPAAAGAGVGASGGGSQGHQSWVRGDGAPIHCLPSTPCKDGAPHPPRSFIQGDCPFQAPGPPTFQIFPQQMRHFTSNAQGFQILRLPANARYFLLVFFFNDFYFFIIVGLVFCQSSTAQQSDPVTHTHIYTYTFFFSHYPPSGSITSE